MAVAAAGAPATQKKRATALRHWEKFVEHVGALAAVGSDAVRNGQVMATFVVWLDDHTRSQPRGGRTRSGASQSTLRTYARNVATHLARTLNTGFPVCWARAEAALSGIARGRLAGGDVRPKEERIPITNDMIRFWEKDSKSVSFMSVATFLLSTMYRTGEVLRPASGTRFDPALRLSVDDVAWISPGGQATPSSRTDLGRIGPGWVARVDNPVTKTDQTRTARKIGRPLLPWTEESTSAAAWLARMLRHRGDLRSSDPLFVGSDGRWMSADTWRRTTKRAVAEYAEATGRIDVANAPRAGGHSFRIGGEVRMDAVGANPQERLYASRRMTGRSARTYERRELGRVSESVGRAESLTEEQRFA